MNIVRLSALAGIALILAGCAQQEETMVRPQPTFDKFGNASCEGGWIYVPGTAPEYAECVPPDECEPVYDSAGNVLECLPPPRRPSGGSDGSSSSSTRPTRPSSPTGSLTAAPTGGSSAPGT